MPTHRPQRVRFFEKFLRGKPNECWPWQGARTPFGYGWFHLCKNKKVLAHRMAVRYATGKKLRDITALVLHHCDNPPCVNPAHLYEGSHGDNSRDKVSRKRHTFGTRNPCAKLDDDAVRRIRKLRRLGYSIRGIAAKIGVAFPTVQAVLEKRTWVHVK